MASLGGTRSADQPELAAVTRGRRRIGYAACAITPCLIFAACSDDEVASLRPGSDASTTGTGRDAARGPRKDSSLDGPAPPAFGYSARPANTSCSAPKRLLNQDTVALEHVWPSVKFTEPVGLLQAPKDSSRTFVLEKTGVVRVLDGEADAGTTSVFLDIQSRVNAVPTEAGLLGMAFDPNFATTGVVYIFYSGFGGTADVTSHIARFRSRDGGKTLDPNSEEILFSLPKTYTNHNGGNIQFGPDGYLYVGLGDGGAGGDPINAGQRTNTFFGKIHRLGVSPTGPYTIPPSNPYAAGGTDKAEIFAFGLRNPWRFSFDRATGDLWVGDVGQNTREEVDRVKRDGNYGWRLREGTLCAPAPCTSGPYIEPIIDYPHTVGTCVIGGYVYRGTAITSLVGTYVYADGRTIYALYYDPKTGVPIAPPATLLVRAPSSFFSAFGEDAAGELYVTLYSTGGILKLVPGSLEAGVSLAPEPPGTLSATGCWQASDASKFVDGVIPYDVNVPYWDDGVELSHGIALRDGSKIKVLADGRFDLPNGTVLLQTASKNGKKLHTRLLARHDDGDWSGYAYEWNATQTDATFVRGATLLHDGSFGSYVTHRAECLSCHTTTAGRILGFQPRQLNRDFSYPNGAKLNQLTQFEHIGLFDSPLPAAAKSDPYAAPNGTAPLDARARTYLEVNCAMCHRPGGVDSGSLNLTLKAALADTGLCRAAPKHGDLRVTGSTLLTPGTPTQSILSLRMHADDWSRMPPLESQLEDRAGAAVIDEWITNSAQCPPPRTDAGG